MSSQAQGSLKPRALHGLAALLILALSALASPAAAWVTVNLPFAATLPKGAPIVVQWSSDHPNLPADIELWQVTPYVFQPMPVLAANVTGAQTTVMLPPDVVCDDPNYVYTIYVMLHQGTQSQGANISRNFTLSCSQSSVTVVKQLVNNNPGVPTPLGPFNVNLDCTLNGPHTTVGLTAPNNLQRTLAIPGGSRCSITEQTPPPPPKNCSWVVSYPPIDPRGPKAIRQTTLIVRNELKCGSGTEMPVTVVKRLVNDNPDVPTPPGPYQVRVDCSPSGPHTVVTLTSPGDLQRTIGAPSGSRCTITELAPPPPPKGCSWVVTYPTPDPGGPRIARQTVLTVQNELTCKGDDGGKLTVVKRVINNNPGIPTPAGPYQVRVDCLPNGPHTTVSLTSPNNLQRTVPIPSGAVCSISELPPPPPPKGCDWSVSYPDGQRSKGGTLPVVNELKCKGATLTVIKRISSDNPGVPAPVGPYQVHVDCKPGGPQTTVSLTSPNNLQQTIPIPPGSVCAIYELPPPPPPRGCEWSVSYPAGQQSRGGTLVVDNQLKCKGAGPLPREGGGQAAPDGRRRGQGGG